MPDQPAVVLAEGGAGGLVLFEVDALAVARAVARDRVGGFAAGADEGAVFGADGAEQRLACILKVRRMETIV